MYTVDIHQNVARFSSRTVCRYTMGIFKRRKNQNKLWYAHMDINPDQTFSQNTCTHLLIFHRFSNDGVQNSAHRPTLTA